jgi:hypothetical protein
MPVRPILPIVAVLAALLVSACDKDSVVNVATVTTKAKLKIADPAAMKLGRVEWIVVTEANWPQVVEKIKGRGEVVVLYALDGKNYKQLRANDAEVIRYVTQVRSNVKAYKKYYEDDGK